MPQPVEQMSAYCPEGRVLQINKISVYHIKTNIFRHPFVDSLTINHNIGASGDGELDLLKREYLQKARKS